MRNISRMTSVTLSTLVAVLSWAVTPRPPQLPDPGNAHMSRADQEKLGLKAAAEVYQQMPVVPDSNPIAKYVQQLGAKLKKQIPAQYSWPYQFHVVQQKEVNAFALPGGPIFINVGTITAAQNEAQLAGVMAHEMSHVYMQHSAKQAHKNILPNILAGIGQIAGGVIGGAAGSIASAGGQMVGGVLSLRYSREDEAQADSVGAIIMFKAGYNPMELAHFFDNLAKQGNGGPQFLSDHPNPGNRAEAIAKEIQDWPHKQYVADSPAFQDARKQADGVQAYTAEQISAGAKEGKWARQNMQTGAVPASLRQGVQASASGPGLQNVSLDQVRPDQNFTEIHAQGLSISYPSNWSTAAGQNSITIAPKAGVSQNALAYGVIVAKLEGGGSLDQATQSMAENLERSNPGLKQDGQPEIIPANGTQASSVYFAGNSPLQQNGAPLRERDWLVVVPASGGSYVSLIFISPERDFAALKPTFQKMLQSLRAD
jgi:predicted Zn-dependent protease